tara:strand:+ start:577 stop:771 length:195 start_codon:yes stop_codon:yes gene_type:complete
MVATREEAKGMIRVILRHITRKKASQIVQDLRKEIASASKNRSLKETLVILQRILAKKPLKAPL